MKQLDKVYNPADVEAKTYQFWTENDLFKAEIDADKKPYTIVMPPPNITGELHMGHAMDATWQDILIRHKRMQGYSALWIPGTDHASIATEALIVADMKKEGLHKEDIGRDAFVERAWEWKEKYGGRITEQLKELGASCDWSRERFTMDEGGSKAVKNVFVRLFDEGLIYRGERIINWCPYCLTSISDAEVEHEEQQGNLWHIRYPVVGTDEYIVVATTRPETMLGDTAVAIHPDDERYKHLHGKKVMLPLMDKEIPIVLDSYVDAEFGTGAVKVTPGHDMNDFDIGERHDLPIINIMTEDGHMNENAGRFNGLERYAARKAVVEELEKLNLLEKIEDHLHNVGTCYRCDTVIEPTVSLQWFVKMAPLAGPAIEAVKDGTVQFVPKRFEKTYFHWMDNTRDWCISRQLWWGHRIPAWYCDACGEVVVSEATPTTCTHCGSSKLHQDEDTLDTWFSSALWPFSTLGWPEKTADLDYFYPTSTLVTGYDIIGFWVSRMIFSGLHHTGKAPFDTVLIHGLVLDDQGRKMSKSLGNGINPLDITHEYGADALRLTLVSGSTPGNDMRFLEERVVASRNFANKLWNATRFVLMNLPASYTPSPLDVKTLSASDKWAISLYNDLVKETTTHLDRFEFGLAAQKIHDYIWDIFCDWTIEISKNNLQSDDEEKADKTRDLLIFLLTGSLKLLHPIMPYITEEIYRALPTAEHSIMVTQWPEYDEKLAFAKASDEFGQVINLIRAIRNVRAEMDVHPAKRTNLIIDADAVAVYQNNLQVFNRLAGIESIEPATDALNLSDGMVHVATATAQGYIPLDQLIDPKKELERLEKELSDVDKDIESLAKRLDNPGFVNNAPENVVSEVKEKHSNANEKRQHILEAIEGIKKQI